MVVKLKKYYRGEGKNVEGIGLNWDQEDLNGCKSITWKIEIKCHNIMAVI